MGATATITGSSKRSAGREEQNGKFSLATAIHHRQRLLLQSFWDGPFSWPRGQHAEPRKGRQELFLRDVGFPTAARLLRLMSGTRDKKSKAKSKRSIVDPSTPSPTYVEKGYCSRPNKTCEFRISYAL